EAELPGGIFHPEALTETGRRPLNLSLRATQSRLQPSAQTTRFLPLRLTYRSRRQWPARLAQWALPRFHAVGHWTVAAYGNLKLPRQGGLKGPPSSLAQHDVIRIFLTLAPRQTRHHHNKAIRLRRICKTIFE